MGQTPLDAGRVINGSYGTVYHSGKWMTNVTQVELNVEFNKEEVATAGGRWIGHKITSLTGAGTLTGYKISSEMALLIGQVANDRSKPFVTELIFKLDDPEAYGAERIRVKNVSFDKIDLMNFEVNSLSETELPFTFTGYEFLDVIKQK